MRLAVHGPLISLALCALAPQAEALELYSDEESKTTLNADLSAAYGYFTSQKNYIGDPARPGRVTWQEGFAKAGLSGSTERLGTGSFYGALSVLSNRTWGDGDAGGNTNGTEHETDVEDAYIGWKSGNLFPALGPDGIDISFGKQIVTLDGFLINDDGFNPGASFNPYPGTEPDGRFSRGGAYYLGQRLAFKNSAVLKVGGTEGLHGSLVWLKSHAPQSGTEVVAATVDYTTPLGSLGSTYIHGLSVDDRYVFGFRGERDGMNIYSIRGQGNAGIENADFAFEIARQEKQSGTQRALFLDAGYTFADAPWKPVVSYRYARYSYEWDFLLQGGYRKRYQGEVGVNYALSLSWNTQINDILLQLQPREDLTLNAMFFHYRQLSVPEGGQDLSAREVNLFADWAVTKNFTLSPLVSFYKPKHSVADGLGNQSGNASTNTYFQLIGWLTF